MTSRFRLRIIAPASLALALSQASTGPDISARAVVEAATVYVKSYQDQLTSVLADEVYRQEIFSQVPHDPNLPRTRTLRSEVFFMFAPGGDDWMAIRDVIQVDGQTVESRPDVLQELRRLPSREVAETFKTYNSRFNLGGTYRNFNEPTLSLLVLDAKHRARFSFDRKHVEHTADGAVVLLSFTEKERPTLIRDLTYGAVFSQGELAVEAGTGRIRRAVLTAKIGPIRLELTTEYAPDERLGIWVPARFRERYQHGTPAGSPDSASDYEDILCEATYSNYRRFETRVRIK